MAAILDKRAHSLLTFILHPFLHALVKHEACNPDVKYPRLKKNEKKMVNLLPFGQMKVDLFDFYGIQKFKKNTKK